MTRRFSAPLVAALLATGAMTLGAHAQTSTTTTTPTTPTAPAVAVPGTATPTSPMPGTTTMGTPPGTAATMAPGMTGRTTTTTTTTPGTTAAPAAVNTTGAASRTTAAPVAGANSFTAGEARRRIQAKGFGQVKGLKKDSQGIWRGTAMKDGKSTPVALDYQGNVVAQ